MSVFTLLSNGKTRRLAYEMLTGTAPRLIWLGGFMSDMQSSKVQALESWAAERGQSFLKFDYSGHGLSTSENPGERFIDGTITQWLEDARAMVELFDEPVVLVGSSMGGWIALKLAQDMARSDKIRGMVLIAPAADFTEELMWARLSPQIRAEIEQNGVWMRENAYGPPYPITRALIEDGRNNLILGKPIVPGCPVHILQGAQDPDVPLSHTLRLMQHMPEDTVLTLVQDGDHRLSREQDIALLLRSAGQMLDLISSR